MTAIEKKILEAFKKLVATKATIKRLVLFGSRARGDADPDSDMDIVVVLDRRTPEMESWVSDCAWEAGIDCGIVVCPIVYSADEWEKEPVQFSSFARAVKEEGIQL